MAETGRRGDGTHNGERAGRWSGRAIFTVTGLCMLGLLRGVRMFFLL